MPHSELQQLQHPQDNMYRPAYIIFLLFAVCGAITIKSLETDHQLINVTELTVRDDLWGGFLDTCHDPRFLLSDEDMDRDNMPSLDPYLASPHLSARCRDLDGNEHCSLLDLGECMVNQGGTLYPGEGCVHGHTSSKKCMSNIQQGPFPRVVRRVPDERGDHPQLPMLQGHHKRGSRDEARPEQVPTPRFTDAFANYSQTTLSTISAASCGVLPRGLRSPSALGKRTTSPISQTRLGGDQTGAP